MKFPVHLRGMIAMVLAMGFFIASDTASKFVLAKVPVFEVVFLRGLASVLLCLLLLMAMGFGRQLVMMNNLWVLARGFCEVVANFAFTIAIFHMPIADVTAIAQICPLLVLIGARFIFGEQLGHSRFVLIALGIGGALLVAQPGSTAASPFATMGFLVAIAAAARDLMTRKVPVDIPSPIVAFAVLLILMLAGGVCTLAFETQVVPDAGSIMLIILAGGLMMAGHIGIFLAYKIASARSVAPFMYSLTIWAVLSGVVVFGDHPNALAITGMILILVAGLLVIYVDGRRPSVG